MLLFLTVTQGRKIANDASQCDMKTTFRLSVGMMSGTRLDVDACISRSRAVDMQLIRLEYKLIQ